MLKPSLLIVLFFQFIASGSYCQNQSLDSLTEKLSTLDINEINYPISLNNLSKQYAESDPDTALIIGFQSLAIIQKHKFDSLIGQAYIVISTAHSYKAQYDSSLSYSFKALDIAKNFDDTITIMDAFNNLGIDFSYQEENKTAIEYFQKMEGMAKSFGDSLRWGHAMNNIGMIYGFEEETEIELDHYEKAAKIFNLIGEKEGYANTLLNTGTTHTLLGNYQKAEKYYNSALSIFKEINYTSAIGNTYFNLSENYFKSGRLNIALDMAKLALAIANEYNFDQDKIYTFDLIRQIYEEKGDTKNAYFYMEKYYSLKENVFNSEKSLQISEWQTKYETSIKQSKIEKLTLENQLQTATITKGKWQVAFSIIGAIALITIIILIFWIRSKKLKEDQLEQQLRFEALQKRYLELLNGPAPLSLDIDLNVFNEKLVNPLTEREYDTLKLSMGGKTNKEIADTLFVSISTVKFHMGNIYNKLGVSNKKEALAYVVKSS